MTVVVSALIWRNGRLLIMRRPEGRSMAGYWETPGGKLEPGETPEQALSRELMEETGAVVRAVAPYHAMAARAGGEFFVVFYTAVLISGEPKSLEGGEIRWALPRELPSYRFLPADKELMDELATGGPGGQGLPAEPRLIFVTGGARSGKSSYAEALARVHGDDVLYIATSQVFDDEMRARVRAHRERRPTAWLTHEGWRGLGGVIAARKSGAVLLDCATLLVTNVLLEHTNVDWDKPGDGELAAIEADVTSEIEGVITGGKQSGAQLIVVSNELGMGVVPPSPMGRAFRDIAGRANQRLCAAADSAVLMVSGVPVKLR